MPTRQLQTLLLQLHEEAKRLAPSGDERNRLETLIAEVELALNEQDAEHHAGMFEEFQGKLVQWENDHPTTSGVVQRVMQTLSDMGI